MPYFDPDAMPWDQVHRIDRWLVANGCRDHVALEPVILRGNVVEYTAICGRDPKSLRRFTVDRRTGRASTQRRRRMRIRIPLRSIGMERTDATRI